MRTDEIKNVTKKIFNAYQLNAMLGTPVMVWSVALVLGLKQKHEQTMAIILAGALSGVLTPVPYLIARSALRQIFEVEDPERRLRRLLRAPRVIEMRNLLILIGFASAYVGALVLMFDKRLDAIVLSVVLISLMTALLWVQVRLSIENILRPYALVEFRKLAAPRLKDTGYLWPRQEWFLPYAFGLFILCTAASMLIIIYKSTERLLPTVVAELRALPPGTDLGEHMERGMHTLAGHVALPLTVVGLYMLLSAAISAWRVARHQVEGSRAVQASIESLVSGHPQAPDWVSTDEIGDLAQATRTAFTRLRQLSLALRESAQSLGTSAQELGSSTTRQAEVLSRQATALQQTQVTAQEIKETSALAFQKAEAVLQDTERVDRLSRSGEEAIEKSLSGLESIRQVVVDMAQRIQSLDERAQQIGRITTTVKDLADQSNMLALNAAIEAVRSGEHGKGFAVVAREIRQLANQSITATRGVRDILHEVSSAIHAAVEITERGSSKIDGSLKQVHEFGDHLRQLSGIFRENSASVRQISAAVTQQNAGIAQIFQAVSELSGMMDQTVYRLRSSEDTLSVVEGVVQRVTGFVGEYDWESPPTPPSPGSGR